MIGVARAQRSDVNCPLPARDRTVLISPRNFRITVATATADFPSNCSDMYITRERASLPDFLSSKVEDNRGVCTGVRRRDDDGRERTVSRRDRQAFPTGGFASRLSPCEVKFIRLARAAGACVGRVLENGITVKREVLIRAYVE